MVPSLLVLIVLVVSLVLVLSKRHASESLKVFSDRRRGSSQIVGRGEFVDGRRHLRVALALTDQAFFYENSDMQAWLERQWIHEVEYDEGLSTGEATGGGTVLRLRCFSQTFEFVLPSDMVVQWKKLLPAHRMPGAQAVAVAL